MNKQNKINTVANATLMSNKHATIESSVYAIINATDGLEAGPTKGMLIAGNRRGKEACDFETTKVVAFNAQGILDCYSEMKNFDLRTSFRDRLKRRMENGVTSINDFAISKGMMEISAILAEDCQAIIPSIVSKWSSVFNTGHGKDDKQLRVASYATHHAQFVRAGLATVFVDQFETEFRKVKNSIMETSSDFYPLMTEVYEQNRFTIANRQISANIIAYSFLVASNILACEFTPTFRFDGCEPFFKTSEIYKGLLANGNKDPIETCAKMIAINRFNKAIDSFTYISTLSNSRNWTHEQRVLANEMMLETASAFMQLHFENLNSGKYIENLIDKANEPSIA